MVKSPELLKPIEKVVETGRELPRKARELVGKMNVLKGLQEGNGGLGIDIKTMMDKVEAINPASEALKKVQNSDAIKGFKKTEIGKRMTANAQVQWDEMSNK